MYKLGFYIPEEGILHSHLYDNLKSYIALTGCEERLARDYFHPDDEAILSPKRRF
jgi:hypothetical protein